MVLVHALLVELCSDVTDFMMCDLDLTHPLGAVGLRRQRAPVDPNHETPVMNADTGADKIGKAFEPFNKLGLGLANIVESQFSHASYRIRFIME